MKDDIIKKALDDIMDSYDAFYFNNKYGDINTHKEQFEILIEFFKDNDNAKKPIMWIYNNYDCFYKDEYVNDDDSPFAYLKSLI